MADCTCPELRLNSMPRPGEHAHDTGVRNWDPRCPEHGLESEWWRSPEQVASRDRKRREMDARYLEINRKRREAREAEQRSTDDYR